MEAFEIQVITGPTPRAVLVELARAGFGDMVKGVVDVSRSLMAVGGELHADEEALLLRDGSAQQDLWGINLYPETEQDWIEFDSMINVRPAMRNRSRGVDDPVLRARIVAVVDVLVTRG